MKSKLVRFITVRCISAERLKHYEQDINLEGILDYKPATCEDIEYEGPLTEKEMEENFTSVHSVMQGVSYWYVVCMPLAKFREALKAIQEEGGTET